MLIFAIGHPPLGDDVDIPGIAKDKRCEGFSGADLAQLGREACLAVIDDFSGAHKVEDLIASGRMRVCARHFEKAFGECKRSVTPQMQRYYAALRDE